MSVFLRGGVGRVRVSKLEPHVLGGPPLEGDVDLFLSDLSEQSQDVDATHETTEQPLEDDSFANTQSDGEVKDGFVRLADFLKKKMSKNRYNRHPRSKLAVAMRAYQRQIDDSGEAALEMDDTETLNRIDKSA